ncbi:hypothetical protein B0H66DRAFT_170934 [Apodospora peruviana]|uniref:Uncharacterized protein n=1 Tax=Apodospora peruviana TaxID=516989 RepID=A0AAE0MDB5_9PEZI|nr:hypothetical protein B0H66DRAFT_170934 [Apodospora peruviana]
MEVIRSMFACIFGDRRRSTSFPSVGGYTELTDEKMPLYLENTPYMADNMMIAYGATRTLAAPPPAYYSDKPPLSDEEMADDVVRLLRRAEWNDESLQRRVRNIVGDGSWSRKMVEECLDNVIEAVEDGRRYMGEAMCEALDRATDIADEEFTFPRRHAQSVDGFIAIVAVGILAQMQGPWVLDVLGFGEVEDREEIRSPCGEEELSMSPSSKLVPSLKMRPGSVAAWWAREYAAYIPEGGIYEYFRGLGMVHGSYDDDYAVFD